MGFEQAPDKGFRPRPDLGPAAPGGGRQTELATTGRRSGQRISTRWPISTKFRDGILNRSTACTELRNMKAS